MGKLIGGPFCRAGRVKRLTKKVDKKERPKKSPVGRAKLRKLFAKRYAVIIPEASVFKKNYYRANINHQSIK